MDKYLPLLRVKSGRHVMAASLVITAISVAVPVVALAVPMLFFWHVPAGAFWSVLAICAAIPLLIAAPISLLALSMLRLLTITIERVDDHGRFDTLTGVLTRAVLLARMREMLPGGGSFLMVDADHFKKINDTFGHDVGDEALKVLAEALRRTVPATALVGRLGGEEFGIFLPGVHDAEAATVAEALCAAIRRAGRSIEGYEINLTISVGAAEHLWVNSLERTMKLADGALYTAKRLGRDRFFQASAADMGPTLILKSQGLEAGAA